MNWVALKIFITFSALFLLYGDSEISDLYLIDRVSKSSNQTIDLKPGWNLISTPGYSEYTVDRLFNNERVIAVFEYGDDGEWKIYQPNSRDDIKAIKSIKGYWVYIDGEKNFRLNISIELQSSQSSSQSSSQVVADDAQMVGVKKMIYPKPSKSACTYGGGVWDNNRDECKANSYNASRICSIPSKDNWLELFRSCGADVSTSSGSVEHLTECLNELGYSSYSYLTSSDYDSGNIFYVGFDDKNSWFLKWSNKFISESIRCLDGESEHQSQSSQGSSSSKAPVTSDFSKPTVKLCEESGGYWDGESDECLGVDWHKASAICTLPTKEQWLELFRYCSADTVENSSGYYNGVEINFASCMRGRGFVSDISYWTSSEFGSSNAWYATFLSGDSWSVDRLSKNSKYSLRCARL